MKDMASLKKYFICLVCLAFVVGTLVNFLNVKKHEDNDLRVYHKIALRMQVAPSSEIYSLSDGAFPYRYVPFTLPLFNWMSHFSEITVRYIWFTIQVLSFVMTLWLLQKILISLGDTDSFFTICASVALMFRYYLDSLSSGQIFGVLLLFFTMGLYSLIKQNIKSYVLCFFGAAALKVIPGMSLVFVFFNAKNFKTKCLIVFSFFAFFVLFNVFLILWFKWNFNSPFALEHLEQLWKLWWQIISNDAEYFDGATTKNQAFRGFLLRFLFKGETTELIWKISFLATFLSLSVMWFIYRSQNIIYIVSAYSLSILFYILLMPQSLPYQVINAIIPMVFYVFFIKKHFLTFEKCLFIFILASITLPSSGLLGRSLANQMQYYSLPMLALILLSVYFVKNILQKPKM